MAIAFAHLSQQDRSDLAQHRWHLVEPDPAKVVTALTRAATETDEGH